MVMAEKLAKSNGVVVDVSALTTMRQIKEWQQANASVDLDKMAEQMAVFVTAWQYEGLDPKNPESYLDLTPAQWRHVLQEVTGAIANLFQESD